MALERNVTLDIDNKDLISMILRQEGSEKMFPILSITYNPSCHTSNGLASMTGICNLLDDYKELARNLCEIRILFKDGNYTILLGVKIIFQGCNCYNINISNGILYRSNLNNQKHYQGQIYNEYLGRWIWL